MIADRAMDANVVHSVEQIWCGGQLHLTMNLQHQPQLLFIPV